MGDEDFRRRDRKEARECGDRAPRQVHVRTRLEKAQIARAARDLPMELAFGRERRAKLSRERVDEPEARVVPRGVVLAAGIPQSDDETNRCAHVDIRELESTPAQQKGPPDVRGGPCCRGNGRLLLLLVVLAGVLLLLVALLALLALVARGFCRLALGRCSARSGDGARRSRAFCARHGFRFDHFLDHGLRHDRRGHDGIELAAHDERDARRQLQRRYVDRVADVERSEIDLDEFGQVLRQARDVELVQHVRDDRAGELDRRRRLGIGEMQRDFHVDLAVLVDALEVDVKDLVAKRVHLDIAQQHLGRAAVELHRQDRRVEGLVAKRVEERVVVELDWLGLAGAAVDDARRLAGAAHAAARSAALRHARKCREFELHG